MDISGEDKDPQEILARKLMREVKLFPSQKQRQYKTLLEGRLLISRHRSHSTVMVNICKEIVFFYIAFKYFFLVFILGDMIVKYQQTMKI